MEMVLLLFCSMMFIHLTLFDHCLRFSCIFSGPSSLKYCIFGGLDLAGYAGVLDFRSGVRFLLYRTSISEERRIFGLFLELRAILPWARVGCPPTHGLQNEERNEWRLCLHSMCPHLWYACSSLIWYCTHCWPFIDMIFRLLISLFPLICKLKNTCACEVMNGIIELLFHHCFWFHIHLTLFDHCFRFHIASDFYQFLHFVLQVEVFHGLLRFVFMIQKVFFLRFLFVSFLMSFCWVFVFQSLCNIFQ